MLFEVQPFRALPRGYQAGFGEIRFSGGHAGIVHERKVWFFHNDMTKKGDLAQTFDNSDWTIISSDAKV